MAAPKLPPHPGLRTARLYRIAGGLLLFSAVFSILATNVVSAALTGVIGVWMFVVAQRFKGQIATVQLVNAANQAISRGELDEATRLLDEVPARYQARGYLGAAGQVQRALVAFYRGKPDEAARHAELALGARGNAFSAFHTGVAHARARAVHALAAASLQRKDEVEKDVAALAGDRHADAADLARGELARALVLASANDMTALEAHLKSKARLLLDASPPRERGLVRALRRMTRLRKRSIYREPSPPAEAGPASELADWVAKIAPDAAAYLVGRENPKDDDAKEKRSAELPASDGSTWRERVGASGFMTKLASRPVRAIGLWLVLVMVFLGIWQILTPPTVHGHTTASSFSAWAPVSVLVLGIVFLVGLIRLRVSRGNQGNTELATARRDISLGHLDAASERLGPLISSQAVAIATAAMVHRIEILERQAKFADALQVCDEALARIKSAPRAQLVAVTDSQLPMLLASRAYCLATMGEHEQAGVELAALKAEFPGFWGLATADLRVRMMMALMRDDLEGAAAVARERKPELPLPLRDDVLCDMTIAMTPESLPDEELERVDAELRDDEELNGWIGVIAPSFRELLQARLTRAKVRLARDSQLPPRRDVAPSAPAEEEVEPDLAKLRS